MTDVTRILNAIEQGDAGATEKLLPLVYEELRLLAAQKMSQERPGQTLQATALVHEAYLRLVGAEAQKWDSRGHFFAADARRKRRFKHGGEYGRVNVNGDDLPFEGPSDDLIALDEALTKLADIDKVKCDLIKLRYFAGLSIEQAAGILGISPPTAKRYWRYARAWLFREIRPYD
jgi:RNA polymerase sigma factor (TIGR02999 family)